MAMSATIWNKNRTDTNEYQNVYLCSIGIIVKLPNAELLIPFASGRIHEVYSKQPGEIIQQLGQ